MLMGATSAEQRAPSDRATLAVALVVALAVSSVRLVAAPGFEFYLGPFFYLLAWRWLGLKPALLVAVVTMAPTIFWWNHPVSILLAVGHVLAVDRFSRGRHSFSTITLLYQGIVGGGVGFLFLSLNYASPMAMSVIVIMRKVLSELIVAGLADVTVVFLRYDRTTGRLRRNTHLSLQFSIDALVSVAVASAATLFLIGQVNGVSENIATVNDRVSRAIETWPQRDTAQRGRVYSLALSDDTRPARILVAEPGRWKAAGTAFGCKSFETEPVTVANDRNTFSYWLGLCLVEALPRGNVAIVPIRPIIQMLFVRIGQGVLPLALFLLAAQLTLILFRRAIQHALDDWRLAIDRFSQRRMIEPGHTAFAETAEMTAMLARANNDYVVAERERMRLARAVTELRGTMDLKLFSDVQFDPDACALRFVKLDPLFGQREMKIAVSPADRGAFSSVTGQSDIMVEFRLADGSSDKWYLLLAHEYDVGFGGWRYGCVIRLRTAKAFQTKMRHSARLMELGGMASALSHELRQPLFTIALAAENGSMLLDAVGDAGAPVRRKFERIIEQVERATSIVQRTSTYARIERDEREPTDLLETVQNAARFMRAVLQEREIHMSIDAPDLLPTLMLPRVGVEQIVVNALQNAADSIEAARLERVDLGVQDRVVIRVTAAPDAITVAIEDSGAGIPAELADTAFQAFSTTKPVGKGTGLGLFVCRQIIDEVGGIITLVNNTGRPGATLRMQFPVPAGAVAAAA